MDELRAALVAGELERARDLARERIAADADDAYARATLGVALQRLGDLEAAIAELDTARLDLADSGSRFNRALALESLGRLGEAIDGYREALRVNPALFEAALNLGGALYRAGELGSSRAAYAAALDIDPGSATARHMTAALDGETTATAPPAYVRELFDSSAPTFDQHLAALDYQTPEALGSLIAEHAPAGARVLDLGCGTGLLGAVLRSRAALLAGVDLSPAMLARARDRGDYDELVIGEAVEHLRGDPRRWDVVAAADALPYFGDLEPLFVAVRARLSSRGVFAFSIERGAAPGGWSLQSSGRYNHDPDYVAETAGLRGLQLSRRSDVELRRERGVPVAGALFALTRA
jgi:predicted TPR repeat methyltransferase